MVNTELDLWAKFKRGYVFDRKLGFALDTSRIGLNNDFIENLNSQIKKAFLDIAALEKGVIANPDEKRMVGHYWLRDSSIAPNTELKQEIDQTLASIKAFAKEVHQGSIAPEKGGQFKYLLVVGIGGSALGPQFVNQALGSANDPMEIFFFDNTDPDGMNNVLSQIPDLAKTLCLVISKSGGTKETRNGQLIAKEAYKSQDLDFSKHFVAITGVDSELDKTAVSENWLRRFPMWDWVGGRTSELSAVGLLPAALQGFDIQALLDGAKIMDAQTRKNEISSNPALLLALSWYYSGGGRGLKDMVVLPYKDRLELFSRYLQQLVMESLGKEHDLNGNVVNQGIAVYGNKGSTDQHAYVQQLRDGVNNFFAVFIEVLCDDSLKTKQLGELNASKIAVEQGINSGDYLSGFYLGTRKALFEKNRESVTITVDSVKEETVGMLIALFERAVSIYASLVNINAYHQPGVEAGKKAAAEVLNIQKNLVEYLAKSSKPEDVESIAKNVGKPENVETIFKILRRLSANGRVRVDTASSVFEDKYSLVK
jgi:glucose-6-phosphate isomerase